jgi:hypothetical protein
MSRQRVKAPGTDSATNDDADESSPRRGRVLASLVEGQQLLNEAVTKVADYVTREKEEKKESDPWKTAVEKAMGKAFPSDLHDEKLTEVNILESRIACDPRLLPLVMTTTEMPTSLSLARYRQSGCGVATTKRQGRSLFLATHHRSPAGQDPGVKPRLFPLASFPSACHFPAGATTPDQ